MANQSIKDLEAMQQSKREELDRFYLQNMGVLDMWQDIQNDYAELTRKVSATIVEKANIKKK